MGCPYIRWVPLVSLSPPILLPPFPSSLSLPWPIAHVPLCMRRPRPREVALPSMPASDHACSRLAVATCTVGAAPLPTTVTSSSPSVKLSPTQPRPVPLGTRHAAPRAGGGGWRTDRDMARRAGSQVITAAKLGGMVISLASHLENNILMFAVCLRQYPQNYSVLRTNLHFVSVLQTNLPLCNGTKKWQKFVRWQLRTAFSFFGRKVQVL